MKKCQWALHSPVEEIYHDEEWGVPVYDDQRLFEFLILEGAQAGLSWCTILNKRSYYREAFDEFDVNKVANYTEQKLSELLVNPGIIRNALKVRAAITNAQAFIKVQQEFGNFSAYIWDFVEGKPIQNHWRTHAEIPASTALSAKLSKDLKQRGFKFVGEVICYAHMQATGMVNDHVIGCFRHAQIMALTEN